jgi:hypothetical protein
MDFDTSQKIEKIEKTVLDFLNYIMKETPLSLDLSNLYGEFTWVTSPIKELKTNISMPAEFYFLNITNYPMEMIVRYCPCEYCHKVVYVQLIIIGKDTEVSNAKIVMEYINKTVPDIKVYITRKPEPLFVKNNGLGFKK